MTIDLQRLVDFRKELKDSLPGDGILMECSITTHSLIDDPRACGLHLHWRRGEFWIKIDTDLATLSRPGAAQELGKQWTEKEAKFRLEKANPA